MSKKSFNLRIQSEYLHQIEKWADDEFRSVNGQIEYLLCQALKEHKRFPVASLQKNKPGEEPKPEKPQGKTERRTGI